MNAATRVNRPAISSSPSTNSMTPAYQNGQVPVGTAPPGPGGIGHANSFEVPCTVSSRPKTIRNTDSTTGASPLSLASI